MIPRLFKDHRYLGISLWIALLLTSEPLAAKSDDVLWRNLLLADQPPEAGPAPDAFYLSDSPVDPASEMQALLNGPTASLTCRFPARMLRLKRSGLLEQPLDFAACEQLQEFMSVMAADSLELIFAGPSVASPMSYFGHLFLKFKKKDNPYFSRTITFLAPIEAENSMLSITLNGALSTISGQYQVAPYHQIINQYILKEQRPLQSYELAITPENQRLLLYHMFELAAVDRPYNFFQDNCATRIQELLSIAFPEEIDNPISVVSPQNVVQSVQDSNLVVGSQRTPAQAEALFAAYHALSSKKQETLKALLDAADKSAWVARNGDDLLPLAQAIYRLRFRALNSPPADYTELMRLPAKPLATPKTVRPVTDRPRLLALGWRNYPETRATMRFRPGLFEPSRATLGLATESSFRYLDTTLGIRDENVTLERLDLLALSAIKKRSVVNRPLSWSFSTGWGRDFAIDQIHYQVTTSTGVAWGGKQTQFSLLPTLTYFAGEGVFPALTAKASLGLGSVRVSTEIRHFGASSDDRPRNRRRINLSYTLHKAWELSAGVDQVAQKIDVAISHRF